MHLCGRSLAVSNHTPTHHTACAALRLYERALALRPQHAEALYNMGVACYDAGHVERASFFYESALAHAPSCAEAWNNLGTGSLF